MTEPSDDAAYRTGEFERADWQRPDIEVPADPRGGFKHNPEFFIAGTIDNGSPWSSTQGNVRPST